jgi:hypothetical protein
MKVLKIIGYVFAAFWILEGVGGNLAALAAGVGLLAIMLLATNAWGLRAHVPHFNSPRALHRRAAYAALVAVTFLAVELLPAQTPEQQRAEAQADAAATATALRSAAQAHAQATQTVRAARAVLAHSTPRHHAAAAPPTTTPVTARRLVGAPAQRAAGAVVLGASEAAWKARLGPMMQNTGGGVDGWFPCPARPQQAGVLVMVVAGRVTTTTHNPHRAVNRERGI